MGLQSPQTSGVGEHIEEAKRCFLTTKLIHIAVLGGIASFGIVTLTVTARQLSFISSINNPLIWVALIGCLGTIALSFLVTSAYRKKSTAPGSIASLRSALQHYQAVCMLRWAITGTGALFSGIVFLITRNILPVCFLGISVYVLSCLYPSLRCFTAFTEDNSQDSFR